MSETPALGLPLLRAEQAQKHVTHNEALRLLDAVVQLSILDRDMAAPPGAPAEGARYIVASGPTGAWAGHAGHIAAWQDGAWEFLAPREGWICWVRDEDIGLVFDGAAWLPFGGSQLQNLTLLGLGTVGDATNPFAAKLNKALWTAKTVGEGGDGDLRYTLNKETAADVLSLLLQSGFSGRAELGLIGNDNLSLKVSPDGVSWVDALVVDSAGNSVFGGSVAKANIKNAAGNVLPVAPPLQKVGTDGPTGAMAFTVDNANGTIAPAFFFSKGRGAGAIVGATDTLGTVYFNGSDGVNYVAGAAIRALVAGAPAADVLPAQLVFYTNAGSAALTERLRIDSAGAVSHRANAQVIIDANSHLRLRSYTVATLPDPAAAAGQMIFCSDLGGGGGQLNSDGAVWRRVSRGGQQTIATNATATLAVLTNAEEILHTAALTADRTLTLATANAYPGARFRVTRTGNGAFVLSVGGLKNLVQNSWAEVIYHGSAWYLAASGAL